MTAPATFARNPEAMEWADLHMERLLEGGCGVNVRDGWLHFTVVVCCNEFAVTAKKIRGRWAIKNMVCTPST